MLPALLVLFLPWWTHFMIKNEGHATPRGVLAVSQSLVLLAQTWLAWWSTQMAGKLSWSNTKHAQLFHQRCHVSACAWFKCPVAWGAAGWDAALTGAAAAKNSQPTRPDPWDPSTTNQTTSADSVVVSEPLCSSTQLQLSRLKKREH